MRMTAPLLPLRPKNADRLATNQPAFPRFSPGGYALWARHHLELRSHKSPNGDFRDTRIDAPSRSSQRGCAGRPPPTGTPTARPRGNARNLPSGPCARGGSCLAHIETDAATGARSLPSTPVTVPTPGRVPNAVRRPNEAPACRRPWAAEATTMRVICAPGWAAVLRPRPKGTRVRYRPTGAHQDPRRPARLSRDPDQDPP